MTTAPSISAFFPCYNDAGTIASLVVLTDKTLREVTDDYEIIVIDDGSKDHSREILAELAPKVSRLRVVLHEANRGYGGALKSGFAAAGKEFVFYTDGDFQYDPSELRLLLDACAPGIDVVNGYKIRRSDPLHRRVIGRAYHHIVRILFGLPLRDTDCDFRLIRRSALGKITLVHNTGVICLELVTRLHRAGCRFSEVPVSHYGRGYGRSQFFRFRRVARMVRDVLKLWWRLVVRKRDDRPGAGGRRA